MACPSCKSEEYRSMGVFGNREQRACMACGNHYDGPVLIQEEKELYQKGEKREIRG